VYVDTLKFWTNSYKRGAWLWH